MQRYFPRGHTVSPKQQPPISELDDRGIVQYIGDLYIILSSIPSLGKELVRNDSERPELGLRTVIHMY